MRIVKKLFVGLSMLFIPRWKISYSDTSTENRQFEKLEGKKFYKWQLASKVKELVESNENIPVAFGHCYKWTNKVVKYPQNYQA